MPKALLLYHFFAPDAVVSARHFAQLAEALSAQGWDVEAWPSNRLRRSPHATLPPRGREGSTRVRRCWRPPLSQDRALGRLANTAVVLLQWCGRALTAGPADVVVVGTDPPMSPVVSRVWGLLRPNVRLAHWAFDLYPEAAVAHGVLRSGGLAERLLRAVAGWSLRGFDAIADIGSCMGDRIGRVAPGVPRETLVPWALVEPGEFAPPDPELRRALFGDARTVLLYAGRLGRAYDYHSFLTLGKALREDGVVLAFQSVGEREQEIYGAAAPMQNLRFLPPCSEADLPRRLALADFHLVSLRPGWAGIVVPSKFFAAMAVGRPVVFDGPPESAVARWIADLDVGVSLGKEDPVGDAAKVREAIRRNAAGPAWARHCWEVGRERFSREAVTRRWGEFLSRLVEKPVRADYHVALKA